MPTAARPHLDLLVLQPTSLCNLDCSYCYVPDRQDARRMPRSTLERSFRLLCESGIVEGQDTIRIVWHAGEPLAAGLSFYREAFELADRILGIRWRVRHSIQTNATLVDSAWCDFVREHGIAIGVSLDGPERIHDANRPTRGGRGSFAATMRGIELLRAAGIPFTVLAVLSSANCDEPDAMFRFFLERGFGTVAFNVDEIEGDHTRSSLLGEGGLATARRRYRRFMRRVLELNREHGYPIRIRELTQLARAIEGRRAVPARFRTMAEHRGGVIVTIARDGSVYSWSPELATGTADDRRRFALGNVAEVRTLDELLLSPRALEIQAEIDRGLELCRTTCAYFALCGGGSPANKFYEHGTFATAETLKCALQVQELTEVVLESLAQAAGP